MLNQKELALEVCNIGYSKVHKKSRITFISAVLAGAFIAFGYFGFLAVISQEHGINSYFFGSLIFTVGLAIIIIAGGELFTGNCLITLGWFNKRYKFSKVAKNLLIVYFGNLVGALIVVALVYYSGMNEKIIQYTEIYTHSKTSLTFMEALLRGILCNVLVAVGVYMSYATKNISGRIIAAMLPATLFVVSGFEHSVANMFILFLGKVNGLDVTLVSILIGNLLPVTIGNIIGGSFIIPGGYYFTLLKDA